MNTVKEEESLTADSGESTAGEDDFNPFGNSGSEDEGNVLSTLYVSLKKNPRIRPENTLASWRNEEITRKIAKKKLTSKARRGSVFPFPSLSEQGKKTIVSLQSRDAAWKSNPLNGSSIRGRFSQVRAVLKNVKRKILVVLYICCLVIQALHLLVWNVICLVAQTRRKEAKGRENGCRFRPFI